MRELAAVVARELQEWRRIFVAALASGFLVLLAPLMPGIKGHSALEAVDATSGFITAAFALGVALLAGGGLIGRELAERRMGFYFFKPLRDGAIWGGKLLAAVFLAFFSAMLVLVPPMLMGRGLLGLRHEEVQRAIGLLGAAIVALVVLGNSIHLTFRSRSKWSLLDLMALLVLAGLLSIAIYPLMLAAALELSGMLIFGFVLLFLLTLAVAGYIGIRRGRTDLREVHKYHALALWPVVGVAALAAIGFSYWVRSAGPEDLVSARITELAPTGSWLGVSGESQHRGDFRPGLLINAETGEQLRFPAGAETAHTVTISRDGRRAVWLEPLGVKTPRGRVVVASLERKPRTRATTIFASRHDGMMLSPDGSRLAVLSGTILTVLDTDSERALASARIPGERFQFRRAFFAGPNLLRVYERMDDVLKIYELDIPNKRLEETGSIDVGEHFQFSAPAGDMMALRLVKSNELQLRDARSGRILVAPAKIESLGLLAFLADGRFAVARVVDGRGQLAINSPAGVTEKTIELGPAVTVRLGGQPEQGYLVVGTSQKEPRVDPAEFRKSLTVWLVELESGKIKEVGSQMSPLTYLWWFAADLPTPGSISSRLYITADYHLLYFDPISGQRRVLTGPAAEM